MLEGTVMIDADFTGTTLTASQATVQIDSTGKDRLPINVQRNATATFTNLGINLSNSSFSAINVEQGGKVNISGHTQINLIASTEDVPTAIVSGDFDGNKTYPVSEVNLNTANISITGGSGLGLLSDINGKITATGSVHITGAGEPNFDIDEFGVTGAAAFDGGIVDLTAGGTISVSGTKSAALMLLSMDTPSQDVFPSSASQISLTGFEVRSTGGNVIQAFGGASNLNLNLTKTTATAEANHKLIEVSNGSEFSSLTDESIPSAANFTLNANASTLSGNITVAADGSAATLNFNNGSTYTGAMSNVTRSTLDASSRWNMTGNSTITQTLNNAGTVYFKNLGQTLTTANYVGTAGSVISLETKLGDDNSTTDKLHVTGNTSGSTRLEIRNAGGTGAQTVNGINVVQVDGTSAADSFTMAAPVQAGAYEYTLKQGSALDANDWYLTSKIGNSSGGNSSGTTGTTTLYRPAVAAYVVAQTANTDATFDLMSSLHQRMGEQRGTSGAPQTWGKIFTAGQSNNGKNRFEYDQFSTGFQFGRDVWSNNTSRAGVTLNYAYSDIDARDSARAQANLAQNTGTIKSTALGLGGYFTQHMSNGMYVDVVGQANHITNKFNDSYSGQSKQKGWQAGLSTEIGKTVGNIGGWNVEPQAQLSYAYGNYKNFADAYSTIGNDNTNSLRGRLGVRLFKDLNISGQAAQYYGIANIGHDFIKPKNVTLSDRTGSTTLNERFDSTYAEIGAGVSGQVSKTTSLHADARYQRSFKGNKEGAHLDVGVKVQF
jgi:outer membrane autotransporter protein